MKTYAHFFLIFIALLVSCKTPYKAASSTTTLYKIEASAPDSLSPVQQFLQPYHDQLSQSMNEVIGYAEGDFVKMQPSGSLGSLVADAMLDAARLQNQQVKGAICNYGGIRIPSMMKGDITIGKLFEMLPFENELVIVEVSGAVLHKWLSHIEVSGGWPIARTYDYEILEVEDGGGPGISTYRTLEKGIEDDSLYYFATNDYVANGGDNCEFLKACKKINTGLLIRDVMIRYSRERRRLVPDNTFRMRFK
ncbi:MAG: 5'-nucleotidase C-terminal domain-containing protein [Chitinophagaceae bacterium]|nr:5'-nucleotidase C-terminal domain-containing protein [Chitinophagaceae bacterium]